MCDSGCAVAVKFCIHGQPQLEIARSDLELLRCFAKPFWRLSLGILDAVSCRWKIVSSPFLHEGSFGFCRAVDTLEHRMAARLGKVSSRIGRV